VNDLTGVRFFLPMREKNKGDRGDRDQST
jgi:hypothetical protein